MASFPDPDQLSALTPAAVLDAAAQGHLGLDHRFLHALLDRPQESQPALLAFAQRDRSSDAIDLAPELICALSRLEHARRAFVPHRLRQRGPGECA